MSSSAPLAFSTCPLGLLKGKPTTFPFPPHTRQHNFPISSRSRTTLVPSQSQQMEFPESHSVPWQHLIPSHLLFPYNLIPENYVHWTETPESHIFSADIPGVRKEELRVEVEDSRYLTIRTEAMDESTEPARKFKRKFRMPGRVNLDGITAGYENGVLTITVPRSLRRGFYIDPADVPDRLEVLARAA